MKNLEQKLEEKKKKFDIEVEHIGYQYDTHCKHNKIYKYLTQSQKVRFNCGICGAAFDDKSVSFYNQAKIVDKTTN